MSGDVVVDADYIRRLELEIRRARGVYRAHVRVVTCCEREAFETEGHHGLDCPRMTGRT